MAMAAAARALALAACLASAAAARRPLWSWPVSSSTDWLWDLSRELPARPAFSCDPGDDPVTCASLGEFYAATNGSGWVNAKGWATAAAGVPTAICTWYGVGCSPAGSVTTLSLAFNGLSGQLPDSIAVLSTLESLWLGDNGLVGTVPSAIGSLVALGSLALTRNRLSGLIPASIGRLSTLQYLFLGTNLLGGPLPASLGELTQLLYIDISNNGLVGAPPSSVARLTNLQRAGLADSGLCGVWPGASVRFDGSLPHCAFACAPGDDPAACAALGDVYDASNGPAWLRQDGWAAAAAGTPTAMCTLFGVGCDQGGAVTSLSLQQNGLSGSLPPSLGALTRLTDLWLTYNALAGTVPASIASLTSLVVLSLADNKFTGAVPEAIGSLAKLQFLFLENCELTGSVPASIASLANLQLVGLEHSGLCGEWPAAREPFDGPLLPPCPAAAAAEDAAPLSPSEPWYGTTTTALESSSGELSYEKTRRWRSSAEGPWRFVAEQQAPPAFACALGDDHAVCAALGDLYASTGGQQWWDFDAGWAEAAAGKPTPVCDFYGVGCDVDGTVTSLYLSRNALVGVLQDSIGALSRLRMLDLSSNGLGGAIPEALWGLHEMQYLNIAGNHFDGPAPLSLRSHALRRLKMDWEQFA